ncbi:KpsF/GutQ family sugar-phosphate isomerase [Luteibaculum oceani]|uniref:KpsF/GutQ family sugar-phosphate isomerase n=1 Tax=Luteibaculum oceani TaxID=1294296 RepID=A0A5C6V8Q3_9FLAO|nr:KpsF/GutQ family sugar-phosphate isomerase [Luteibaculum oceani]TXC81783.1 KpsF/GutQ family sugar-phosphate isomerase [Luteibaculum oceani]
MDSENNIKNLGKRAIKQVAESINKLLPFVDDNFEKVVKTCMESEGRLVISGIGKSALIGQKLVATLNSTGTPAIFLHAADAIHGDLGMVQPKDLVMLISKSGNSPEIKVLLPYLKAMGNTTIAMTGNLDGFLAKNSDLLLNTTVSRESCPNNLAPTTSTAAQLIMGDALAVTLMELKGFGKADFAKYHPGGALGKKLYLKVEDILDREKSPVVAPNASWKEVILEISAKRLGAAVVMDGTEILGIITDGDIRRMLEKFDNLDALKALDIMSENPKQVGVDKLAYEAFQIMENNNITQLVVVEGKASKFVGLIHIHDILKEGIF